MKERLCLSVTDLECINIMLLLNEWERSFLLTTVFKVDVTGARPVASQAKMYYELLNRQIKEKVFKTVAACAPSIDRPSWLDVVDGHSTPRAPFSYRLAYFSHFGYQIGENSIPKSFIFL